MRVPLNSPDVVTPAFLVDRAKVQRNCEAMREKAQRSGVLLRPHVKTHKTREIARMQVGGETGPITVSTFAEAEFFARHGFDDITYAVPISPEKLPRAATLGRLVKRLNLLVDNAAVLPALDTLHRNQGVEFDVFIKVDCGYHRAGVDPRASASLDLVLHLAAMFPGVRLQGLLTHAGHSYHARNREEISKIAAEETGSLTEFRRRILDCLKENPKDPLQWALSGRFPVNGAGPILRSTGSTPTACVVENFQETDEVRPGNYVFFDAFQLAIGSCEFSQCAASVLATVIGSYADRNELIIDAGALALSKDPGPNHLNADCGYGILCDLGLRPLSQMKLTALSQEHGIIAAPAALVNFFPVGSRLRVIPNHSCLTAAMYKRYYVIEEGNVTGEWHPVHGW